MKKIIIVFIMLLSFTGCSLSNTPKSKVESYLNNYNSLGEDVIADMESKVAEENLSKENRNIYKKVLTRQYEDLKYEIKDEVIDGDNATVTVKLTVYDLYKSTQNSLVYLNNNQNEFFENNAFSDELYNKYKLNEMLKMNDTIDYEVKFNLNKKDNEWILENPDRATLEKMHGLYNYEFK